MAAFFFSLGLFLAPVCPWSAEAATGKLRAVSQARSGMRRSATRYTWRASASRSASGGSAPSHSSALSNGSADHVAACPRSGVLRARGGPLARAAARVCREAGATVQQHVLVRVQAARRAKERTYPELVSSRRCHLTVLGFASSLLGLPPASTSNVDGHAPAISDVFADSTDLPPLASRMP